MALLTRNSQTLIDLETLPLVCCIPADSLTTHIPPFFQSSPSISLNQRLRDAFMTVGTEESKFAWTDSYLMNFSHNI